MLHDNDTVPSLFWSHAEIFIAIPHPLPPYNFKLPIISIRRNEKPTLIGPFQIACLFIVQVAVGTFIFQHHITCKYN